MVKHRARTVLTALALVLAAMLVPAASAAQAAAPNATTGTATDVTSTTATLEGAVSPNQTETTYYFQFGPSTDYGMQTPSQGPVRGKGDKNVKADVTGLAPGTTYHFRLVAVNATATATGADATFTTPAAGTGTTAKNALTFKVSRPLVIFGSTVTFSGQLTGEKNAGTQVTLEEDPFPYGDGYKATTRTADTDATGNYTITATPGISTRYRVTAKTKPPVTSGEVSVKVRVKVTLRLSDSTPAAGRLVRFSGLALPAHNGAIVRIQRRTSSGGYKTVASTKLVATTTVNGVARSRYAKRLRIRSNGIYRVHVSPGHGDHAAGVSARRRATIH